MIVEFKSHEVFEGLLVGLHPKLARLLRYVVKKRNTRTLPVITSTYRENDSGVHGCIPLRGIDLRSNMIADPETFVKKINADWIYDPDRANKQCAILHDTGSGEHIHLQVHENTVSIMDENRPRIEPNVKKIVYDRLKETNSCGLFCLDMDCSCKVENIMPCGHPYADCRPDYYVEKKDGKR